MNCDIQMLLSEIASILLPFFKNIVDIFGYLFHKSTILDEPSEKRDLSYLGFMAEAPNLSLLELTFKGFQLF